MKCSDEQRASTVSCIYPCDTQQKVHTMEEPPSVPDDLLWVTSASSALLNAFSVATVEGMQTVQGLCSMDFSFQDLSSCSGAECSSELSR